MGLFFGRKKRSRGRSITTHIPLIRFIGPVVSVTGILFTIGMVLTGQINLSSFDMLQGDSSPSADAPIGPIRLASLQSLGNRTNETIRIATFNIQDFGKQKATNAEVMPILATLVSQFDVIAIQEVRGGDATPAQTLVELLRASGAMYAGTVSEPIGTGSQAESYAYIWDDTRVRLIPQSAYVVQDSANRMHRQPMVASFESRVGTAPGRRPFRFTLINSHTPSSEVAPSAAENEMNVLDDVFLRVRQYDYQATGEEDCILLGDLNVDTAGLRELGQIPNLETIAGDTKTNTLGTHTYDHILIDRTMTREYTGRYGVIDLQRDLGLSEELSLRISDHQPLWAEFSAYETPQFDPVATAPNPTRY